MEDPIIKKHNFEQAKNKIKEFSENLPSYVYFRRVEEDGGLFNWGDHTVTGKELNEFIETVQSRIITINDSLKKTVSEFGEVYRALDFLDNEYIKGILMSLDTAKIAIQQSLSTQEDLKKTIESLKKTVVVLNNFKEAVTKDLSEFKRIGPQQINALLEVYCQINNIRTFLYNVDEIWTEIEQNKSITDKFNKSFDAYKKRTDEKISELTSAIKNVNKQRQSDYRRFKKKLSIGYSIIGGTVALFIGQVILQLLGIL